MPIPAIIAGVGALVAPLVGGAMSLAGGALSMAGGLTHAASTAAGMSWDIGKGVAGAAGGMLGGGESGNVEQEPRATDPLGGRALPPGTKVNSAGVIVYDKGSSRGGQIIGGQMPGMTLEERIDSIGPVDRSDASPLQRILDHVIHISTNTDRISAGIGLMVAGQAQQSVQENLDKQETDPKGPGAISRGLSKTWSGIKNTLGSVGSGLKMALKAIALGGIFILYRKYRENIKEGMAGIFETFDEWYHFFKESDNPWETAWEGIKGWGKDTFDKVKDKLVGFITDLIDSMKIWVNETTGHRWFKNIGGDVEIAHEVGKAADSQNTIANLTDRYSPEILAASADNIQWERAAKAAGIELDARSEGDRMSARNAIENMLKTMINVSRSSGGRIQWSGIMRDLSKLPWQDEATNPLSTEGINPLSVMRANPVVDGFVYNSWDVLDKKSKNYFGGLEKLTAGLTEESSMALTDKLRQKSMLANSIDFRRGLIASGETVKVGSIDMPYTESAGLEGQNVRKMPFGSTNFIATDVALMAQLNKDLEEMMPNASLQNKVNIAALDGNSISTHDHHLEELLKPVAKAFAEGKQTPSVVMAPDNRNQSVTKLGDTYSGGLSSRVQDNTALMLAYTKNLNSTTGQFA